jgi:hypothetical protein
VYTQPYILFSKEIGRNNLKEQISVYLAYTLVLVYDRRDKLLRVVKMEQKRHTASSQDRNRDQLHIISIQSRKQLVRFVVL